MVHLLKRRIGISLSFIFVDESEDNDQNDYQGASAKDSNYPEHTFASGLLMHLRLFNIFLCFFRVFESRPYISIDFDQIRSLIVHLFIDILSDYVNVCHELLNVIQIFLPLFDNVFVMSSFSAHFELLQI